MEGVTFRTFEPVPAQSAIVLHVSDHRFNGTAPFDVPFQSGGNAAFQVPVIHLDVFRGVVTTVAEVDKCLLRSSSRQDLGLLQRFVQGMAVIGIARQAAHADHQSFLVGGGDGDFDAELIRLAGFAFADAFHLRRVQAVELVLVFFLLRYVQPVGLVDGAN